MERDFSYNEKLTATLIGRRLRQECMPEVYRQQAMFAFWGEDVGFPESDMHSTQAYRIYVEYNGDHIITDAWIQIDGEILSPCSGYAQEVLDQFDFPPVLNWCMEHTATA